MNQEAFASILVELNNPEAEAREKAVADFSAAVQANGSWVLQALSYIVSNPAPLKIHLTSLNELYELLSASKGPLEGLYMSQQPAVRDSVKASLITAFDTLSDKEELSLITCKCIVACISKLYEADEGWDELFDHLYVVVGDPTASPAHRTNACELLGSFGEGLKEYLLLPSKAQPFFSAFMGCFKEDGATFKQKVDSASAVAAFLPSVDLTSNEALYQPLYALPQLIFDTAEEAVRQGKIEVANQLLGTICEVVPAVMTLPHPLVVTLAKDLHRYTMDTTIDTEVRRTSMLALVSLCDNVPAKLKKFPNYLTAVFDAMISVFLKQTEAEINDWDTVPYCDIATLGGAGVDISLITDSFESILAATSKGKQKMSFASHVHTVITGLLQSDSWEDQHAALCAIAVTAKHLLSTTSGGALSGLVPILLFKSVSEHKYLRFRAFQCLAFISEECTPQLQLQYHDVVIPAFNVGLQDDNCRVRTAAATAVGSFFCFGLNDEDADDEDADDEAAEQINDEVEEEEVDEDEEKDSGEEGESDDDDETKQVFETLTPYSVDTIKKLINCLHSEKLDHGVFCVYFLAIENVSVFAKADIIPHLPSLMASFEKLANEPIDSLVAKVEKYVERETVSPQKKCLVAALECVSTIPIFVKLENFTEYVDLVATTIFNLLKIILPEDGDYYLGLLRALGRLIKGIGAGIFPLMPMFVPHVIELITEREVRELESDEDADQLHQHVQAFDIIGEIAKIGGDIGPEYRRLYSETAHKQMRCSVATSRMMASEVLERLVPSYKFAPEAETKSFVNDSLSNLIRGMKAASHLHNEKFECLDSHFDAIAALAAEFGSLFQPAQIVDITDGLAFFCGESVRIRINCHRAQKEKEAKEMEAAKGKGKGKGKGYKSKKAVDEEEEEEEDEEEEEFVDEGEEAFDLLFTMNDTMEHMLKNCPVFTPLYREKILPLNLYSMPKADDEVCSVGVGYISDYCQYSYEDAAMEDAEVMAKVLLALTANKGLGHGVFNALRCLLILITRVAGVESAKNIQFARVLLPVVNSSVKLFKKEKDFGALNNAVSCGLHAIQSYSTSLELADVMEFFSMLPTLLPLTREGDWEEAASVHKRLVEMLSGPADKCLIEAPFRGKYYYKLREAAPKTIDKETKAALSKLKKYYE